MPDGRIIAMSNIGYQGVPCVLVFVFVFVFFVLDNPIVAILIFLLAGATDVLDGYLARKYNWITNLGKILDPLADKMMQCTVLVCLFAKIFTISGPVLLYGTLAGTVYGIIYYFLQLLRF